jgi:hypothetical protein
LYNTVTNAKRDAGPMYAMMTENSVIHIARREKINIVWAARACVTLGFCNSVYFKGTLTRP